MTTIFLDTNALITLSGLKDGELLDALRGHLTEGDTRLYVSHVQVDEKLQKEFSDYQKKVDYGKMRAMRESE